MHSQAINICFHHLQLSRTEQPPWSVPLRRSPCFPGRETLPGRRPMWPGMDGGNPRYLGCRSYRDILNVFLWIYYSIHTQKHTHTHTHIYIYAIGKTIFFKYFSDLQVIFHQLKIASTTKSRVQSCSQGTCGSRASAQSVAPPQLGPESGVTRYFMGFSWGYTGDIQDTSRAI